MRMNVGARDSPHKARSAGRSLEHGCLDWIVGSFRSVGYDGSSNKAKKIEENQRGSPKTDEIAMIKKKTVEARESNVMGPEKEPYYEFFLNTRNAMQRH